MDIYFLTIIGEPIDESQAIKLRYCKKIYEINGVIKKDELYIDGKLGGVTYYRDAAESESQAINILLAQGYQSFDIAEKTASGSNIIEAHNSYRNGILNLKGRYMINPNGFWIAKEEIDITTNLPVYENTKKYYYDSSFGIDIDEPILTCDYNSNGTFSVLCFGYAIDEQDAEYCFSGENPDDIRLLCGMTVSEMSFYLTAAF
jgi:hypothetical protein